MTDKYPPGFEFMAKPTQEVKRINGFAPGDRVQVIDEDSRYYGKFGRVINSFGGCWPEECGTKRDCILVEVSIDTDINPIPEWTRYAQTPMFRVKDLTHVD